MGGRRLDDEASAALDVPVRPVGGGPRGDQSARRASLIAIAIAVGIVLFAVPKGSPSDGIRQTPPGVAQASPGASPDATPDPTPRRSPRPTLPPLPEIPNEVMLDAPHPAFYARRGEDLEIRHWVPGFDELQLAATIPGAFEGMVGGDSAVTLPSPDGRAALILTYGRADGVEGPVRLVTDSAGTIWEGTTIMPGRAVWSADSRFLALMEDQDSWWIIDTAAFPPSPMTVDVPQPSGAPEPSPRPFEPFSVDRIVPIAFSADGTYLYGGEMTIDSGWQSIIRIAVDTTEVEPIDELPVTGPAAATVVGFGYQSDRDPLTGRTATFDQTGPAVLEPDGTVAFRLAVPGAILAMVWAGDGRLITVETEGRDEIGTIRVTPWTPDGTQGPPLLVTSHPAWVSLTDIRDGHLLLGFVSDFPSASLHPLRLVLLRLDDGATSTIDLDTDRMAGVLGLSWYEPPERVVILD